jgi:aminoglycoside phosphotransferase (APT) family kinase protein
MTPVGPAVQDEVPPWRLFVGHGPHVVVAGADAQVALASVGRESTGSMLVILGPGSPRTGAALQDLLEACGRVLCPGGRIALLARNPGTLLHDALHGVRSLLAGPAADSSGLARWRRDGLVRAASSAGFVDLQAFACTPASPMPITVEVVGLSGRSRPAAWLLTAARPGDGSPFALEEMLRRVSAHVGKAPEAWSLERVTHSERGKSIALCRGTGEGVVLRIARCEAMRRDEERSAALLATIGAERGIAGWVPRPLASGSVDFIDYHAQTRLPGRPLGAVLTEANRSTYVEQAGAFLRALNPRIESKGAEALADTCGAHVGEPMIPFALRHLESVELRERAAAAVSRALERVACRRGIVHGDFGTGNILVDDGRISGVIDWEAAYDDGPPVFDAINLLDAVHRHCHPDARIFDTLPALASGEWPVADEVAFLRGVFDRCGADFANLDAFVMLYVIFHVGPQLRYARSDPGPAIRLEQVLRRLMSKA